MTLKSVLSVMVSLSMTDLVAEHYKDDVKEVTNGREGGFDDHSNDIIKTDDEDWRPACHEEIKR